MTSWSEALAAQAASDLKAYDLLAGSALPVSHRLHYLQMWLEKLWKAYVYQNNIEGLKFTHNVIATILPRLIDEHWRRIRFPRPSHAGEIRKLCLEMDLLHSQADQPDVEYPWPGSSGAVEIPARWSFPLAGNAADREGYLPT
jgi:hypothetical protein